MRWPTVLFRPARLSPGRVTPKGFSCEQDRGTFATGETVRSDIEGLLHYCVLIRPEKNEDVVRGVFWLNSVRAAAGETRNSRRDSEGFRSIDARISSGGMA